MKFLNQLLLLIPFCMFALQTPQQTIQSISEEKNENYSIQTLRNLLKKGNNNPNVFIQYSKFLKKQGKADSSYYYIKKAEPLILSKNNKDSILLMYTLKAEISRFDLKKHLTDKNIGEAEDFYLKNQDYNFKPDVLVNFLNRKAACYNQFHFGNKDTLNLVLRLSDKVIALQDEVKDKSVIAYSMNEKAQVYDYYYDRNKARLYFKEAYEFSKKHELEIAIVDIAINRSRNYLFTNELDKAIDVLIEALPFAEKNNQLGQARDVAGLLSAFYNQKSLYKQALKYKELQRQNEQAIFEIQKERLISDADYKQQLKTKSQEIRKKNIEVKTTRKYLVTLLTIVVLLIVGAFLLQWFYQKLKKKK